MPSVRSPVRIIARLRHPRQLEYHHGFMPILGIDIGGTRLKAGLVDDAGGILESCVFKTPGSLDDLGRAMEEIVASLGGGGGIEGIGIGCKGIINSETTKVEVLPGT